MPAKVMTIAPGRYPDDCAIVALSTYLGKPYEDVLAAAQSVIRPWTHGGLTCRQIQAVGKKFKARLRTLRDADWQRSYGVLLTKRHAVVLRHGLVFEADATVWTLDHWLAHHDYRIERLLTDQPR